MKRSPDKQKLDGLLRASELVSDGFMGKDQRLVEEIIEADEADVAKNGFTVREIGQRMRELTKRGSHGLGAAIRVNDKLDVSVNDNRGQLPCPWPHPGSYFKTVTTATRGDTGKSIFWSDLSIHLIEEHGFFEGLGSLFRIDPEKLIEIIF